ncbi:hypothetical protein [Spirosoma endophyticum]|uniref:Uncharacterized protein n=1 Tax=Spirosoma endophyticum TaxID=662367 RepID=A0A1I1R313_9BACT|nr:hypothetical protein [Spirosoma endophyticum]SFD28756.1 hypothetical protein SAMN05216167_104225 [Spirosoma endophyticum]
MKNLRAFVFIIGWMSLFNIAQGQPPYFSPKQYVVKVRLGTQAREEVGILYDLTDSTILLLPTKEVHASLKKVMNQPAGTLSSMDSLGQGLPIRTYRYRDIRRLTAHRKNSLLKGFLIGAAAGAAITVVFNERDNKPKGFIDFPSKKELYVIGISASMPFLGMATGAVMTKRIEAGEKLIAVDARKRLQKFTIVEQAKQAALYR